MNAARTTQLPVRSAGRVTVVIPTYNRAALVTGAVRSALAQTASNLCDIVVIDDGSTDGTAAALREFRDQIRYLHQPNAGVSAARNAGIRACPNEFVAFLDSDDVWQPEHVARLRAALQTHPTAVLAAARGVLRAPDGHEWTPERPPVPAGQPVDLAPHLFERVCLLTPTVMVRGGVLNETGLFDPRLPRGEDSLVWLRLACRGPAVLIDEPLVTCAWRAPFSLTATPEHVLRDELRVRWLMQRELRRRPDCAAAWRSGLGRLYGVLRDRAYGDRHFGLAARYGIQSLAVCPRQRPRWEWGRPLYALTRLVTG